MKQLPLSQEIRDKMIAARTLGDWDDIHCSIINERERQLLEMIADRNLWRDAHNEDCPNYFALDAAQQQAVEANEKAAKFEKRAAAYRNLLVQIAQDGNQFYLGIDYSRMIANLDKLLAQEEAQEKK